MAKVDGSLGSLVQGVSQQPSRARLPGQSEEQTNVTNDEVFGMSRRPSSVTDGILYEHTGSTDIQYNRFRYDGALVPYSVSTDTPEMHLFIDGAEKTVLLDAASTAYLTPDATATEWNKDVVVREMGDKLVVLNKRKTVYAEAFAIPSGVQTRTVIYARGGQYATGYSVKLQVGGLTHSFTFATPDGSVATDTEQAVVRYIIKQLYELMTTTPTGSDGSSSAAPETMTATDTTFVPDEGKYYASAGAQVYMAANFNVSMVGEHLVIWPISDAVGYTVTANETTGTDLFVAVRDTTTSTGRLPTRAPIGMVVKIENSVQAEDDFYLKFVRDSSDALNSLDDRPGRWEETATLYDPPELDATTMPHELYLDGATWKIRAQVWEQRTAGDAKSNPLPKFVGSEIVDISEVQGRAVYLHDTDMSFSQTDAYTNWFKQTASAELATDPINIRSTSVDGSIKLVYIVPFNRDIVVFGTENTQFLVSGRSTLTPATASMVLTSEFEADLSVRPVTVGENIMFTSWTGKFTHVHEMFLQGEENSHGRRSVTDHVPRYLPGRVTSFTASDGDNTAAVVVAGDPNAVFVYEFLWQDGSKVQSAWSRWEYNAPVLEARIDEGSLFLAFSSGYNGALLTTTTLYRSDTTGLAFQLHLDQVRSYTMTGGSIIDMQALGALTDYTVIALTGDGVSGMPLAVSGTTEMSNVRGFRTIRITLAEPYTGNIQIGYKFTTRVVPTMPVVKDREGVPISASKLAVISFLLSFETTGPFTLIRECLYEALADYWKIEYSGRLLGSPSLLLGEAPVADGTLEFPFDDQSNTSKLVIECTSHLPMTITEIEWNGNTRGRSRRV